MTATIIKPGGWRITTNTHAAQTSMRAWQHDWPKDTYVHLKAYEFGGTGYDAQDKAIAWLRSFIADKVEPVEEA